MENWTRQQLLVAFHLYCEVPFGKIHHRNPLIVEYAEKIGRTPSALALKLTNIASLDPAITSTGRSGMRNASAADQAMWREMNADWETFALESQEVIGTLGIESQMVGDTEGELSDAVVDYASVDVAAETKVRVGQKFFRAAVLSSYNYRCCITGLALPSLLVASHIVPWREDATNRLNPKNGLCLSALHDRAFDAGVITVGDDMVVRVSAAYERERDQFFRSSLDAFEGKRIALPEKFSPDPEFLAYHRRHIFQG